MEVIKIENLTKDYGHGRGIYDVSFTVKKGEVMGFLGPNGAGKSTTMRHLMGFSNPQKGFATIDGLDCWKQHSQLMKNVGYLPGEVALPDGLNGKEFLKMMQDLRKCRNQPLVEQLLKLFDLNLSGDVRKMSIGEKRKLAVVAAFMNDPEILLLDEPTSGLDPTMQEVFIEFILKQKERGKTILLSSHIFNEVEALCDRIAIIKEGKIVTILSAESIKKNKRKTFELTFNDDLAYSAFQKESLECKAIESKQQTLAVYLKPGQTNEFIRIVSKYPLKKLIEHPWTLEEYFMHFYKSDRKFGGI